MKRWMREWFITLPGLHALFRCHLSHSNIMTLNEEMDARVVHSFARVTRSLPLPSLSLLSRWEEEAKCFRPQPRRCLDKIVRTHQFILLLRFHSFHSHDILANPHHTAAACILANSLISSYSFCYFWQWQSNEPTSLIRGYFSCKPTMIETQIRVCTWSARFSIWSRDVYSFAWSSTTALKPLPSMPKSTLPSPSQVSFLYLL